MSNFEFPPRIHSQSKPAQLAVPVKYVLKRAISQVAGKNHIANLVNCPISPANPKKAERHRIRAKTPQLSYHVNHYPSLRPFPLLRLCNYRLGPLGKWRKGFAKGEGGKAD
jgi:hypothetical protein